MVRLWNLRYGTALLTGTKEQEIGSKLFSSELVASSLLPPSHTSAYIEAGFFSESLSTWGG